MSILRPAYILDEVAEFLAEGGENFVFIFDGFWESRSDFDSIGGECNALLTVQERYQLISRSVRAKGKRNCAETMDCIQS